MRDYSLDFQSPQELARISGQDRMELRKACGTKHVESYLPPGEEELATAGGFCLLCFNLFPQSLEQGLIYIVGAQ